MNDVVTLRIARAPHRVALATEEQLALTDSPTLQGWLVSGELPAVARGYAQDLGLLPPTRRFRHPDPIIASSARV